MQGLQPGRQRGRHLKAEYVWHDSSIGKTALFDASHFAGAMIPAKS